MMSTSLSSVPVLSYPSRSFRLFGFLSLLGPSNISSFSSFTLIIESALFALSLISLLSLPSIDSYSSSSSSSSPSSSSSQFDLFVSLIVYSSFHALLFILDSLIIYSSLFSNIYKPPRLIRCLLHIRVPLSILTAALCIHIAYIILSLPIEGEGEWPNMHLFQALAIVSIVGAFFFLLFPFLLLSCGSLFCKALSPSHSSSHTHWRAALASLFFTLDTNIWKEEQVDVLNEAAKAFALFFSSSSSSSSSSFSLSSPARFDYTLDDISLALQLVEARQRLMVESGYSFWVDADERREDEKWVEENYKQMLHRQEERENTRREGRNKHVTDALKVEIDKEGNLKSVEMRDNQLQAHVSSSSSPVIHSSSSDSSCLQEIRIHIPLASSSHLSSPPSSSVPIPVSPLSSDVNEHVHVPAGDIHRQETAPEPSSPEMREEGAITQKIIPLSPLSPPSPPSVAVLSPIIHSHSPHTSTLSNTHTHSHSHTTSASSSFYTGPTFRSPLSSCSSSSSSPSASSLASQGIQPPLSVNDWERIRMGIHFYAFAQAAYGAAAYSLSHVYSCIFTCGLPLLYSSLTNGCLCSCNKQAFIEQARLSSSDDVLDCQLSDSLPVYYLSADRQTRTLVISFRGTGSMSDCAIDLYSSCSSLHSDTTLSSYSYTHSGILMQARRVIKHIKERGVMRSFLQQNEGWEVVLCGHSLGAGLAVLVGLMMKKEEEQQEKERGRQETEEGGRAGISTDCVFPLRSSISPRSSYLRHIYSYAPPLLLDPLSSQHPFLVSHCTSFIYNNDLVSRLSLCSLLTLKARAGDILKKARNTRRHIERAWRRRKWKEVFREGVAEEIEREVREGGQEPLPTDLQLEIIEHSLTHQQEKEKEKGKEKEKNKNKSNEQEVSLESVDMNVRGLYLPGTLFHFLPSSPSSPLQSLNVNYCVPGHGFSSCFPRHAVVYAASQQSFNEIIINKSMFFDHWPQEYVFEHLEFNQIKEREHREQEGQENEEKEKVKEKEKEKEQQEQERGDKLAV